MSLNVISKTRIILSLSTENEKLSGHDVFIMNVAGMRIVVNPQ